MKKLILAALGGVMVALTVNAWTIRPGLQQGRYGRDYSNWSIDWVPSYDDVFADSTRPLEVVPGTVMADVGNSESNGRFGYNYTSPYSGGVFWWDLGERQGPGVWSVTAYAYRGEVYLEAGKTYGFGKRFSDYIEVLIDDTQVLLGRHQTEFSTGTYSPAESGWYPIKVMLVADNDQDGDGTPHENKGPYGGGIGSTGGVSEASGGTCGLGLAWNDTGYIDDYTDGEKWSALRDSGDMQTFRYADTNEDIITFKDFKKIANGYRISAGLLNKGTGSVKILVNATEKALEAGDDGSGWEYVSEPVVITKANELAVFDVEWSGDSAPYFAFLANGVDSKSAKFEAGSKTYSAGGSFNRTVAIASMTRQTNTKDPSITLVFNNVGNSQTNQLIVAYGAIEGGDTPTAWGSYKQVANIAGDVTSYVFDDFPEGWGENINYLRFFVNDGEVLPYWKEVEWIEANGSAAVLDTGYVAGKNTRMEAKFIYRSGRSMGIIYRDSWAWCFGNNRDLAGGSTTFSYQPYAYGGSISTGSYLYHNVAQHIELGDNYIYDFDTGATNVEGAYNDTYDNTGPILLNYSSDFGRFYYVRFREGGERGSLTECAADLIPVIDWSGEVCMYDKVSGEFRRNNAASGTFFAGPVVNESAGFNVVVSSSESVDITQLAPQISADYRRSIDFTIDGYAGVSELNNFPVLVKISEELSGFKYADMKSPENGADLAFTDMLGNTLDHEIETWNTNGVSLIWVSIPKLTTGTKIRALYGRPAQTVKSSSAVWTKAGYVGVWHMDETDGNADAVDATGHNLDAKVMEGSNVWYPTSQMTYEDGVIGICRNNGYASPVNNGYYLQTPDFDSCLSESSVFTVSCWFKFNTDASVGNAVLFSTKPEGNTQHTNGWVVVTEWSRTQWLVVGSVWSYTYYYPSDPAEGWVNMAFAFHGNYVDHYVNGAATTMNYQTKAVIASGDGLSIGNMSGANAASVFGAYDEVRLRNATSTPDWLKAEYDTATKANFMTAGVAQAVAGNGFVVIVR